MPTAETGSHTGRSKESHGAPVRQHRRAFQWSVLVAVALLGCALGAELLVRVFVPDTFFWPISAIYRADPDPAVGYTLQPHFKGVAFGVDVETNSWGFRGRNWGAVKPKDRFRIALIGDSHAFAYGVPFEQSVGEVLAARLNDRGDASYEVLSYGVPGYNSANELAVLQRYALAHHPDVVILMPSGNDHLPGLAVDADGWLVHRAEGAADRRIRDAASERIVLPRGNPWARSRLVLYLKLARLRGAFRRETNRSDRIPVRDAHGDEPWMGPVDEAPLDPELIARVSEPLRQMIELAQSRGARVCLASVTAAPEYRRMLNVLQRDTQVPLLELVALLPGVDSLEMLRAKYSLGWDSHFNARAHTLWAHGLVRLLDASNFLPERRAPAGVRMDGTP